MDALTENLIKLGMAVLIGGTWHTIGSPKNHEKFVNTLLKDKDIEEFVY